MKLDLPIARPKHPDLVSRASDDFTKADRLGIQRMTNWQRSQWARGGYRRRDIGKFASRLAWRPKLFRASIALNHGLGVAPNRVA